MVNGILRTVHSFMAKRDVFSPQIDASGKEGTPLESHFSEWPGEGVGVNKSLKNYRELENYNRQQI